MIIKDELYSSKKETISMSYEIECVCEKCNCNKITPLVTAICDSCLKDKHVDESI